MKYDGCGISWMFLFKVNRMRWDGSKPNWYSLIGNVFQWYKNCDATVFICSIRFSTSGGAPTKFMWKSMGSFSGASKLFGRDNWMRCCSWCCVEVPMGKVAVSPAADSILSNKTFFLLKLNFTRKKKSNYSSAVVFLLSFNFFRLKFIFWNKQTLKDFFFSFFAYNIISHY